MSVSKSIFPFSSLSFYLVYNYIWNNFGQGYVYSYKNKSVQPLSAINCFRSKKNPSNVFNKILNTSLHGGIIEFHPNFFLLELVSRLLYSTTYFANFDCFLYILEF